MEKAVQTWTAKYEINPFNKGFILNMYTKHWNYSYIMLKQSEGKYIKGCKGRRGNPCKLPQCPTAIGNITQPFGTHTSFDS